MFSQAWRTGATRKHTHGMVVPSRDEHRFNELVRLHQEMIYNFAYRLLGDAQEAAAVTEESFLTARNALARMDHETVKLHMLRIASGACQARLCCLDARDGPVSAGWRDEPGKDMDQRVCAGILTLPVQERIVLVLSDVLGLSYGDVGQITGMRYNRVRECLGRGRARLRDHLLNPHHA